MGCVEGKWGCILLQVDVEITLKSSKTIEDLWIGRDDVFLRCSYFLEGRQDVQGFDSRKS